MLALAASRPVVSQTHSPRRQRPAPPPAREARHGRHSKTERPLAWRSSRLLRPRAPTPPCRPAACASPLDLAAGRMPLRRAANPRVPPFPHAPPARERVSLQRLGTSPLDLLVCISEEPSGTSSIRWSQGGVDPLDLPAPRRVGSRRPVGSVQGDRAYARDGGTAPCDLNSRCRRRVAPNARACATRHLPRRRSSARSERSATSPAPTPGPARLPAGA